MKLWERVIEKRLTRDISVSDNQFGFMGGRSTKKAIHLIRRLMEFYIDKKKDLQMIFIDLEKAYDRVSRHVLRSCLQNKDVTIYIKDMYERNNTRAKTLKEDTWDFVLILGCIKDQL